MQIKHPSVAEGVAEHSDFESDPLKRLFGTLEMTYTIVFGTDEQAEQMARSIHRARGRHRAGLLRQRPRAAHVGACHARRHVGPRTRA